MVSNDHPLKGATTNGFTGAVVHGILKMDWSDSIQPARRNIAVRPVDVVDIPDNEEGATPTSALTCDNSEMFLRGETVGIPVGAPSIPSFFLQLHRKEKTPPSAKNKRGRGCCRLAEYKMRSNFQCVGCGLRFCVPTSTVGRKCLYIHVARAYMASGNASDAFRMQYNEWIEHCVNWKDYQG